MSGQDKTKVLLQGTAILALAALLSKVLGVIYRIPYQNITGNIGLYVYQQVYPLYSLLLILATAGFPIAISKLIAERLALGDEPGAKRIFRISIYTLLGTGVVFFLGLYYSAPLLASWMEDERLTLPIRSVSYALLIVPVMAAIRGYFQGYQNMIPTAISQIVEQITRVFTILILSYWFIHNQYDEYYAGAGAVFGAFTGAVAAFIVLLLFWRRGKRTSGEEAQIRRDQVAERDKGDLSKESTAKIMQRIVYLSLPICIGAMVLPLLQLVDSLTVVKVLIASGWEHVAARDWKGIFDRGQPLVQFAAFFATSLSLALVPSISEAHAKQNHELILARSEIALKLTLYLGLAASFGLAVLAEPVNIMLYKTNEGTGTLAVLAFTTIFSTMGIASGAILQGLGQVMLPARNLFIGVCVKLALNVLFIPLWGIAGAALATVLAYAVATILNIWALHKLTGMALSFKLFFARPIIAVLAMAICVWLSMQGLETVLSFFLESGRIYYALVALVSVGVGVISFGVALLRSGAVTREDLSSIPKVNKCIPILDRLKVLK